MANQFLCKPKVSVLFRFGRLRTGSVGCFFFSSCKWGGGVCENLWNIPFWYHLAPVLTSLEGSCNSQSIVPRDFLSLSSAFQKSPLLLSKGGSREEGSWGRHWPVWLVPLSPFSQPLSPHSRGQNGEKSALVSGRKALFRGGWEGRRGSWVELAIFQLLRQPPLLEENLRNWKQEKWDVYQVCRSIREVGVAEKWRQWSESPLGWF